MILHYLKVALRNLRKNKTQHLISALCLAIGILTCSFMLCFVYTVGEEEEYIGGERAMRLMISKKDFAGDVPCVEEDFRALKSQTFGMLEGWAVFSYEAEMEVEVVEKDGRETPYKVTYKVTTPATFPFWKLPLLYGSRLPEREDEIIVSASFARRMAGSENPVGRIVRLADKIAYLNHDVDDAIRGGLITEEDIPKEYTDVLGHNVHDRLNSLIHDVITHSFGRKTIVMSPDYENAMQGLRKWMFGNIYTGGRAKAEEHKAQQMIELLFDHYMKHPEELTTEYRMLIERGDSRERAVCDYISGMTDNYAIEKFEELFVPLGWRVS